MGAFRGCGEDFPSARAPDGPGSYSLPMRCLSRREHVARGIKPELSEENHEHAARAPCPARQSAGWLGQWPAVRAAGSPTGRSASRVLHGAGSRCRPPPPLGQPVPRGSREPLPAKTRVLKEAPKERRAPPMSSDRPGAGTRAAAGPCPNRPALWRTWRADRCAGQPAARSADHRPSRPADCRVGRGARAACSWFSLLGSRLIPRAVFTFGKTTHRQAIRAGAGWGTREREVLSIRPEQSHLSLISQGSKGNVRRIVIGPQPRLRAGPGSPGCRPGSAGARHW